MATYAIGDIQGCYREFMELLDSIRFDSASDTLWLAGDLVNRGPDSLLVLRTVMGFGECVISVLGNHDLHLLALASGVKRARKKDDTLESVLQAAECEQIICWLRQQKLCHYDNAKHFMMVHAGVLPQWSFSETLQYAQELERILRGDEFLPFMERLYGDKPRDWKPELTGWSRLRLICNVFTRIRFCDRQGRPEWSLKDSPDAVPEKYIPWYACTRRHARPPIVFGHWSTLRLNATEIARHQVYPLDTSCVWGGSLTAFRLEDGQYFQVASKKKKK